MHPVPWPHPQVVRMNGQDAEAEKRCFYCPALANTPVPENKKLCFAALRSAPRRAAPRRAALLRAIPFRVAPLRIAPRRTTLRFAALSFARFVLLRFD